MSINKFSHGKLQKSTVEAHSFSFQSIEGIIVLKVQVNGVDGRFILDNGFSLCALDERFAQKANVSFSRSGSVNDANNNNIRLAESEINSIALGPFELKNSFANELNTQRFLPCDSIDGVLGASFINQLNWKIDFETKTGVVSAKEFDVDGIHLPLKIGRNNIAYTELEINDHSFSTMIDFGYQGHLQIRRNYLSAFDGLQAEVREGIQSLSVSGLGNIDTSYICSNISIKSNGRSLVNTPELVIKSNLSEEAVAGINYFENYTVYLNNASKEMILQERANFKFPVKLNFNAALYVIDEKIHIVQINLNDPIHQQIQLMQTVETIDGRASNEFLDICYLKSYIKNKRCKNESIIIQLTGSDREYILQAKTISKQEINSLN